METTGRIRDFLRSAEGQLILTLVLNAAPDELEGLTDKQLSVKITQYRKKRSLDANAYFHVLCTKLAAQLHVSMPWMKNHLIANYGQPMLDDGGESMVFKTNAPPEYCLELETPHFALINTDVEKGKLIYFYRIFRGSHTYDTKEMNRLIEGTVAECKQQDIVTATPAELDNMLNLWETERNRRASKEVGG